MSAALALRERHARKAQKTQQPTTMAANDASTRTLRLWETQFDTQLIKKNKWLWQVSKEVATGNSPSDTNMIWQSKGLAPKTNLSWHVDYALSWTTSVPSSGNTVTLEGYWQPCNKGECFDVNADGYWQPSSETPVTGWLKVGKIDYKYPDVLGIHIIVGVKNAATGEYEPIFVDTAALPPGSTSQYQPQEKVQWWYAANNLTGTVFNKTAGSTGRVDMTNPAASTDEYEWWTTYTTKDGQWSVQETDPTGTGLAGFPPSEIVDRTNSPVVEVWPILVTATLTTAFVASQWDKLKRDLEVNLEVKYEPQVTHTTDYKIHFSLNKKKGIADDGVLLSVGAPEGTAESDVDAALNAALKAGDLPAGEKWNF